jgi:hypothetical protein
LPFTWALPRRITFGRPISLLDIAAVAPSFSLPYSPLLEL